MHITAVLRRQAFAAVILVTALLVANLNAAGQVWQEPVRGSWVREGESQAGDLVLAEPGKTCHIVVPDGAHSAVKQAAQFLSTDLGKLAGAQAPIVAAPAAGQVSIRLATLGDGTELPAGIAQDKLKGQWEAYQILTTADAVWLVGSDARGTAFAVYTLARAARHRPALPLDGLRAAAARAARPARRPTRSSPRRR